MSNSRVPIFNTSRNKETESIFTFPEEPHIIIKISIKKLHLEYIVHTRNDFKVYASLNFIPKSMITTEITFTSSN